MSESRDSFEDAESRARGGDDLSAPDPPDETLNASRETSGGTPVDDCAIPADALPGYRMIKEIHRGGQGVVYQASQLSTRRKAAIKVMRQGPFAGPSDRARFEREVRVLAQIQHPNIVGIHDTGQAAGCYYYVMDYIHGQPLDAYVRQRSLSIDELLKLFLKICDALNAAHLRGVVHRDLKPGNILIDTDGEPHVLDFGLAKTVAADTDTTRMTITGQFLGSLPWAAPEQAEAAPSKIDTRTDVYALGVVLFQLLTGKFPYDVMGNMHDVLNNILTAVPLRTTRLRREIGNDLDTVVQKCLEKDRPRRYQTAGDLARDIRHYLAGEPIEARRASIMYMMRTRTATAVGRRPIAACLAIVLISVMFAQVAGGLTVFLITPLNSLFEQLVQRGRPTTTATKPLKDIRVVALRRDMDYAGMAQQVGLSEDVLRNDLYAMRRVHGLLMQRLCEARPAVVVWNIHFRAERPEYDNYLAAGMQALRDAGIEVVVGVPNWSLGPDGLPELCRAVLRQARWGSTPLQAGQGDTWKLPILIQHGLADPLPSMELQAYAAFRQPGCRFDLRVNLQRETITLLYWRRTDPTVPSKALTGTTEEIRLSAVRRIITEKGVDIGVFPNDLAGYYLIELPSDADLERVTCQYDTLLNADPDTLRELVHGRIVIIGDARFSERYNRDPQQRTIWETHTHAAVIDMLLRDAPLQIVSPPAMLLLTALAAFTGMGIGWRFLRHTGWRVLILAACSGLFMVMSFYGAWYLRTLYHPLIAVTALLVASETSALVRGLYLTRKL